MGLASKQLGLVGFKEEIVAGYRPKLFHQILGLSVARLVKTSCLTSLLVDTCVPTKTSTSHD
jgi:hypothetical protein